MTVYKFKDVYIHEDSTHGTVARVLNSRGCGEMFDRFEITRMVSSRLGTQVSTSTVCAALSKLKSKGALRHEGMFWSMMPNVRVIVVPYYKGGTETNGERTHVNMVMSVLQASKVEHPYLCSTGSLDRHEIKRKVMEVYGYDIALMSVNTVLSRMLVDGWLDHYGRYWAMRADKEWTPCIKK